MKFNKGPNNTNTFNCNQLQLIFDISNIDTSNTMDMSK